MLAGLRFVSELGAGTSSIADLYEDQRGQQFVLRTSVLGFDEVFINKHNQYELVYRFSFNGMDTTRTREFAFYDLVSKMPKDESQYFVKMHRYDIRPSPDQSDQTRAGQDSVRFDLNRLRPSATKDSISRIAVEKRIFIRQLLDYGGTSLESMLSNLDNMSTLDMSSKLDTPSKLDMSSKLDDVAEALMSIVKIARKYKWMINDIHPGNICISDSHGIKLIDYGNCYAIGHSINPSILGLVPYAIRMRYESKAEVLDVLAAVAGYDISRIAAGMRLPDHDTYLTDVGKMNIYPRIVKLMLGVFGKSSHKNYVVAMMKDISKGIIIDEYYAYSYFISVLWTAIDKKSFDNYVKKHFPEYQPIALRASQPIIQKVLHYALSEK